MEAGKQLDVVRTEMTTKVTVVHAGILQQQLVTGMHLQ